MYDGVVASTASKGLTAAPPSAFGTSSPTALPSSTAIDLTGVERCTSPPISVMRSASTSKTSAKLPKGYPSRSRCIPFSPLPREAKRVCILPQNQGIPTLSKCAPNFPRSKGPHTTS